MQIAVELNPDTEHTLQAQATANGGSVPEYAAQVLARFVAASTDHGPMGEPFSIKSHQDAVAWILTRNPNLPSNRPEETDWQQLKSEGRRF